MALEYLVDEQLKLEIKKRDVSPMFCFPIVKYLIEDVPIRFKGSTTPTKSLLNNNRRLKIHTPSFIVFVVSFKLADGSGWPRNSSGT